MIPWSYKKFINFFERERKTSAKFSNQIFPTANSCTRSYIIEENIDDYQQDLDFFCEKSFCFKFF